MAPSKTQHRAGGKARAKSADEQAAGIHTAAPAPATMRFSRSLASASEKLAATSEQWIPAETSRENLSSRVQQSVREAILSARFQPGEKLNIREMAKMLGTSATPVREALAKLAAEGAIELSPGHSARIPVLSPEKFLELCEIRKCVEGFAAELAAARITAAELSALRRLLREYRLACTNLQFNSTLNYSRQFRFSIYRAARMPSLERIIEGLWLRSAPMFRLLSAVDNPELGNIYERLIAALAAGDGERAGKTVQEAISLGPSRLIEYFDPQPKSPPTARARAAK